MGWEAEKFARRGFFAWGWVQRCSEDKICGRQAGGSVIQKRAMEPWVWKLLVCLALAVAAYGACQAEQRWVQRSGQWLLLASVGFAAWWWSGSWSLAAAVLLMWFLVPAIQALWLSRQQRFSRRRRLVAGVIDHDEFPEINQVSRDARGEGFRVLGDYWLEPSPYEQGYRLFAHEENPIVAAAVVVRQMGLVMHYDIFLTRDGKGQAWLTWDYPLAYGLEMPPEFQVHRCLDARDWPELLAQHREFLELNGVEGVALRGGLEDVREFDRMLQAVLRHNLRTGILYRKGGDEVAYSWRGSILVGWQVLREMVVG